MTATSGAAAALGVLVLVFIWWRVQFFHRNPPRTVPPGAQPVCPADGRIMYIDNVDLRPDLADDYHRRVQSAFAIDGAWTVIATYLGIFDVHVVRAPIAGTIHLHYMGPVGGNASMGGSFIYAALRRPLPIGKRGYMQKNEFLGVELRGDVRILLVLMADWWIDQIITFVVDGAEVQRGQVIGKIQMGSQVDLWAPTGLLVPVGGVGDRVRAGSDLMAEVVTTIGPKDASDNPNEAHG